MAFTPRDTPAIEQRIQGDLDRLCGELRAADPKLRAVVLTGGFARGEGAVLAGAPQNDYDLVAIRSGVRPPPEADYRAIAQRCADDMGLHIDIAAVASWRLPWVARSVFWFETALSGRTLWGNHLLERIRVRTADDIDPREGLRLLVNRSAGLLFATRDHGPDAMRVQAAKGLLAASDAWLLSRGRFVAGQLARHDLSRQLDQEHGSLAARDTWADWIDWALTWKTDPAHAERRDPQAAWRAAAQAIADAVPAALSTAGLATLEAYAQRDRLYETVFYATHVHGSAPRLRRHATGRVRVATLRLLQASLDGEVPADGAARCFPGLARPGADALHTLASLRAATLQ